MDSRSFLAQIPSFLSRILIVLVQSFNNTRGTYIWWSFIRKEGIRARNERGFSEGVSQNIQIKRLKKFPPIHPLSPKFYAYLIVKLIVKSRLKFHTEKLFYSILDGKSCQC